MRANLPRGQAQARRSLLRRAAVGLARLAFLMGIAVLLPGGPRYVQGWVFLAVFVLCSLAVTLRLLMRDPALLERRLKAGPSAERRPRQKLIQSFASFGFVSLLALPAFDHRWGWSHVGAPLVIAGNLLVMLAFFIVSRVFSANGFAAAAIEVTSEQRLIDTGPYARVRHPMYSGALVLIAGVPLALGSLWGLMALPPFAALLAWRLLDEEALLTDQLPGYDKYRERVRYRLVPAIW